MKIETPKLFYVKNTYTRLWLAVPMLCIGLKI